MKRWYGLIVLAIPALGFVLSAGGCEGGKESDKKVGTPPLVVPRADTFRVVITSGRIAKTKVGGKAWDLPILGNKVPPDAFVKVTIHDAEGGLTDSGQTNVAKDTFTPVWNQEVGTVKGGWTIKLEAWDEDAQYQDEIGKHEFKVTAEVLKKGNLSLKFGQVEDLKIEFRLSDKVKDPSQVLLQQPYPGPRSARQLRRSENRKLAFVLLHGFDSRNDGHSPREPRSQGWQGSSSPLVKALAEHGDVFAISYVQTAAVENIATLAELRQSIETIKGLGYTNIALIGHSAGGLVARHFVEDCPSAGVTRVIQVCTPNAGTNVAELGVELLLVPREQEPFVRSLGPIHRADLLKRRKGRSIASTTEFVVVVAVAARGLKGDGALNCKCQWPVDLQEQGIPCVCVQATHEQVMTHDDTVKVLCTLATQQQARWSKDKVREMARDMGW